MGNNKGYYCYIKPILFNEDKGGFDTVIKLINSSKSLVLINTNGENHLGYMIDPEDSKGEDFISSVFPFIFIHNEEDKKFYDAVTNTPYSYSTYDNDPTSRVFKEDQGALGDYIDDAKEASRELANINVSEYIVNKSGKNIKAYKNALLELEKVIKEGYQVFYTDYRSQERERNR